MSRTAIPTTKLNTGATLPLLGFGTYGATGKESSDSVVAAIKHGFRHIDTAAIYKCEDAVGRGIKESNVDRDELFIVSKVWNNRKGEVRKALDETLEKLDIDQLDLYLMHWPQTFAEDGSYTPYGTQPDFHACWKEMSTVFNEGKKVKAIGVSNFSIKTLEELKAKAGSDYVVPAVNQVELTPDLPQNDLLAYCKKEGIHVTAWSPLGGGTSNPAKGGSPLLSRPAVQKIADAHDASTGQVLIAYALQRGTSVIPKSSTEARIKTNSTIVKLSDEEMQTLEGLHKDEANPRRVPKGTSKDTDCMGWSYTEMGWEAREDM